MNYSFFDMNDKQKKSRRLSYPCGIIILNILKRGKPLRIAICDDNQTELDVISSLLEAYQKERDVRLSYKIFNSSTELASAARQEFDLYLLDIIMPVLNGMDLAREIRSFNKASHIIFLTSSPEFAVDSYTVKASNYLLKPISKERLFEALDDIWEKEEQEQEKYVVIKSSIGIRKVLLSQLVYAEAQERKVIYHLENGEQFECVHRFSTVCDDLLKNREFILPHRSYLVNMSFIRTIGATDIQLQNGRVIPLAQRRLTEIREHYLAFQMEEDI